MTMGPHFSVIIPLYNKAPYVHRAVESVVEQIYKDWELIVVDDGSTDGGADIVKKFFDKRIQLVSQHNSGVSTARNRGVTESTSPFICFLDADDWWEPTFLEEMAGLIGRHPDAGIYGTGYYIVKKGKKRVAPIGVAKEFTEGEINYCRVYAKTFCMPLCIGSVCIPRKMFDTTGGFNPQLRMAEDFDLWIRIALNNPVVLLNKPLFHYNQDVDTHTRAIGSLQPPEVHFAFNTDYLKPFMEKNMEVKHIVEQVQIVCLKQYYLSQEYHNRAKAELEKLDLGAHRGKDYSDYCQHPRWVTRFKKHAHNLIRRLL